MHVLLDLGDFVWVCFAFLGVGALLTDRYSFATREATLDIHVSARFFARLCLTSQDRYGGSLRLSRGGTQFQACAAGCAKRRLGVRTNWWTQALPFYFWNVVTHPEPEQYPVAPRYLDGSSAPPVCRVSPEHIHVGGWRWSRE